MDPNDMNKRIALALLQSPQANGDGGRIDLDALQVPQATIIQDQAPMDPGSFLGEIQVGVPAHPAMKLIRAMQQIQQ